MPSVTPYNIAPAFEPSAKSAFSSQIRTGGAKGRTGGMDHTKGKAKFTRPCTVGWRSQNQPIRRGGGNRTPL